MRGEHQMKRLTWVAGDRPADNLDETSRKNLAGGRRKQVNSGGANAPPEDKYPYPTDALREASGTSIFDPVLCELVYRWFCPPGGSVLDPFAGGSVRGIVAAALGRQYTGIDLSDRQIEANEKQWEEIHRRIPESSPKPIWIVGDSQTAQLLAPGDYDLIFSCPPYADLERYSDDQRDLSTMDYPAFLESYRSIIASCVGMLKQDRFACFVVGDVRDAGGMYRKLPWHTIQAFEDAGVVLYNEAVLVTAVGSLPIRVGKQFMSGRKLGKTHQNVLVFCNGNPKKATEAIGQVDISVDVTQLDHSSLLTS